jgi:amino acid adenylation domain-containing protein
MCVHDLVSVRANATPDAVAIVDGDQQVSYGDLDVRANQLAHLLCSLGVGPEVPVGLCMGPSIDFAVGALGILKAGGAYVPLDPNYPLHRIATLLETSGTTLLLTQAHLVNQLPRGKWRTIVLNEDELALSRNPMVAPVANSKPENLAYIIFTSGSTGLPKGVQITHANLLNLLSWHQRAFSVASRDRATLQASPGFDAAVWELWPYLTAGASLYVLDEAVRAMPEQLRDWMVASGITISFLPTALAEQMIDLPWPSATALRVLLTGADTLRRYPRADLPFTFVNNYGPTECTVVATSGTIHPDHQPDRLPPIGQPIDNTQVYVVDEQLNPVPAGTAGEILIGGAGVARGYLNLSELTTERFVSDRFSKDRGARLYRTGDLGRLLPDGQIAYIGRMDEQIKIRGYRIEPQEIAAVLDGYSGIKASCVSAYADDSGEKRLVAYLVLATDTRFSLSELRQFVGDYLPDYMVPSTFVQIGELPLSPHGKLDRRALPAPTPLNILDHDSYEAPQSPIEERLASFLTVLLGVARVSRDDNFFDLGGHSLLGAQMITKIHESFGVELSLRSIFDHPTLREMSSEIEKLIRVKLESMSEDEAQRLFDSLQPGSSQDGIRL